MTYHKEATGGQGMTPICDSAQIQNYTIMGNNSAFSSFEHVVHAVYSDGALTLKLLKKIAKAFEDQDADWGGYEGILTKGKDLREIVAEVSGMKVPAKPKLPKDHMKWTPAQEAANDEHYDAMMEIFDKVCRL